MWTKAIVFIREGKHIFRSRVLQFLTESAKEGLNTIRNPRNLSHTEPAKAGLNTIRNLAFLFHLLIFNAAKTRPLTRSEICGTCRISFSFFTYSFFFVKNNAISYYSKVRCRNVKCVLNITTEFVSTDQGIWIWRCATRTCHFQGWDQSNCKCKLSRWD